eukprot:g4113.t1
MSVVPTSSSWGTESTLVNEKLVDELKEIAKTVVVQTPAELDAWYRDSAVKPLEEGNTNCEQKSTLPPKIVHGLKKEMQNHLQHAIQSPKHDRVPSSEAESEKDKYLWLHSYLLIENFRKLLRDTQANILSVIHIDKNPFVENASDKKKNFHFLDEEGEERSGTADISNKRHAEQSANQKTNNRPGNAIIRLDVENKLQFSLLAQLLVESMQHLRSALARNAIYCVQDVTTYLLAIKADTQTDTQTETQIDRQTETHQEETKSNCITKKTHSLLFSYFPHFCKHLLRVAGGPKPKFLKLAANETLRTLTLGFLHAFVHTHRYRSSHEPNVKTSGKTKEERVRKPDVQEHLDEDGQILGHPKKPLMHHNIFHWAQIWYDSFLCTSILKHKQTEIVYQALQCTHIILEQFVLAFVHHNTQRSQEKNEQTVVLMRREKTAVAKILFGRNSLFLPHLCQSLGWCVHVNHRNAKPLMRKLIGNLKDVFEKVNTEKKTVTDSNIRLGINLGVRCTEEKERSENEVNVNQDNIIEKKFKLAKTTTRVSSDDEQQGRDHFKRYCESLVEEKHVDFTKEACRQLLALLPVRKGGSQNQRSRGGKKSGGNGRSNFRQFRNRHRSMLLQKK